MSLSLDSAKMPSLRDKIREQAELAEKEAEKAKKEVKKEVEIKKGRRLNK